MSATVRRGRPRKGETPETVRDLRAAYRQRGRALRECIAETVQLERELTAMRQNFDTLRAANEQLRRDRVALAKLAHPTPLFFNPLVIFETQALRDRVLAEAGIEVPR